MFKSNFQRYEYKFLKNVLNLYKKEVWTDKELRVIDSEFNKFTKRTKLDSIAILRKGEVMLGEYCDVDMTDIQDVRDLIYKCLDNMEDISIPVGLAIIAAINKLALSNIDGKENFNNLKKEEL